MPINAKHLAAKDAVVVVNFALNKQEAAQNKLRTNKEKIVFKLNKQQILALLTVTSVSGTILTVTNVSAKTQASGVVKDVTLWDGTNLQGASFASNKGVADLSKVGFNNRASSIAVNNGQKWRFYKHKNFKGEFIEIGPDEARGNIGKFNNQVSSFRAIP